MENQPVMFVGAVERIKQGNQRRPFSKQDNVHAARPHVLLAAALRRGKTSRPNVSRTVTEFTVHAEICCWYLEATWRMR